MAKRRSTKGQRCSVDVPGVGMVDGRRREAQHYGLAVADIAADLGGEDELTRAELELVRRAAGLAVLAGTAEAKLLAGHDIDISELVSVGNAQRRILATLGLSRRQKDLTPDLQTYLKQREAEQ
jgi:hypothetical protein